MWNGVDCVLAHMNMSSLAEDISVAVVGAGPVGLLAALALARRGYRKVRVLDRLPEPPGPEEQVWGDPDRSYNLGLGGGCQWGHGRKMQWKGGCQAEPTKVIPVNPELLGKVHSNSKLYCRIL